MTDEFLDLLVIPGVLTEVEQSEYRARVRSTFERTASRVPTPYENPYYYAILTALSEVLDGASADLGLPLEKTPLLGTQPTGAVNAKTLLKPGSDDYIILFETELFHFVYLFSKAIISCLPIWAPQQGGLAMSLNMSKVRERLNFNPTVLKSFEEVVIAYALTGQPSRSRPYRLDASYTMMATMLCISAEAFALAHEYAHISLRHLSGGSLKTERMEGENAVSIMYSHLMEYEADIFGLNMAMHGFGNTFNAGPAPSYGGSELFFSAMDVMDKTVSVLNFGRDDVATVGSHPSASTRRKNLRLALPRMRPREFSENAIGFGEALEAVVTELWERTLPTIEDLRRSGIRAAPSWRLVTNSD